MQLTRRGNSLIDPSIIKSQYIFQYKDYKIPFPFQPYSVQKVFMSTLIDSLDGQNNALLQSPTGTGKTLCLLSATLAWLQAKRERNSNLKVIYASRTHSQLRQVVKQLKNTCFRPKMITASSRDHSCVNSQLQFLSGHLKEIQCRKRLKGDVATCPYSNIREAVSKYSNNKMPIMDLQQFKQFGLKQQFCPFFFARSEELLQNIDLVLMPYNYILDRNVVSIYSSVLQNAVVVIDEAHNIQNTACEGSSMILSMTMLESAHEEVEKVQKKFRMGKGTIMSDINFDYALKFLSKLQDGLQRQTLEMKKLQVQNRLDNGEAMIQFFMKCTGYTQERRLFSQYLNEFTRTASKIMTQMSQEYLWQFDKTSGYIMLLGQIISQPNTLQLYRLCCRIDQQLGQFELWCIDPSVSFKKLRDMGVVNLILSSGTLSPLSSWQTQLKIPFKFKLSNQHVINNSQVMLNVVQSGINGSKFMFNYANRNNQKLNQDICSSIVKLAQLIPSGIVVFFPSNAVMELIIRFMNTGQYMDQLLRLKDFFSEPRGGDLLFQEMFRRYKEKAYTSKGAIMFAVCRSRISEGIDLSDQLCRAVIFVGVPYPPVKDVKIVQKKKYQNEQADKYIGSTDALQKPIRGQEWYIQQTIRAVNQAIGRAIRHKDDYGAIYLMDCRYQNTQSLKKDLPKWALSTMKVYSNFDNLTEDTQKFYSANKCLDNKAKPNLAMDEAQTPVQIISDKKPKLSLKYQTYITNQRDKKSINTKYQLDANLRLSAKTNDFRPSTKNNTTLDKFFSKK